MINRISSINLLLMASLFFGIAEISFAQEKAASRFVDSSNKVVAPAPDFQWKQGSKTEHLSSLRGKPVLLLVTDSPLNHAFRHQLNELKGHYERFAAHGLICVVAFTQEKGAVPSNIPFITLLNGAATAKAYGIQNDFGLALLGADGNLDCLSSRPLSGQRIYDLMDASYTTQEALRKP